MNAEWEVNTKWVRLKPGSLIAIGKVVKAFGIRGELVVTPLTKSGNRFKGLRNIFVGSGDADARKFEVAAVRVEPRGARVLLATIDDRTSAEKLVGLLVFVDRKAAVRLPKGTFFVHDLIGIGVVDENGNAIGSVKEVLKYPAHDVYVVDHTGSDLMIPAVKEFITKIDVGAKIMHVKLIDGMLNDAQAVKESDED